MAEYFYADRLFNGLEREEPAPGMLLVAAPGMVSEEFARTVILIISHTAHSTLGVILNRRSEVAVETVLPDWTNIVSRPQALYIGGPVGPQAVVGVGVTKNGVVISEHSQFTRLANKLVQVDLRVDPIAVAELLEGMRMFAGYAEWAPGQLDSEIERGDWFIAPALPSDVVAAGAVDVWGDVMRRQAMPLPLFATYPAHIEDN